MHVVIVGGGLMGVTLAYHLTRAGHAVTLFERHAEVGGLAGGFDYGGQTLDRFYHTILSSDLSMHGLIRECGLQEDLRFTATRQGFYDDGHLYPFNSVTDFMRFPPLNLFQRFRLGLQVIAGQITTDAARMDTIPVEEWLLRVSGRGVVEKVWKPLLRAKFDSETPDVPATYIWARLRRMMSTRQGVTSQEMMCYLIGGYHTLIDALADESARRGAAIRTRTPVDEVLIAGGQVTGVRALGETVPCDAVVLALPSPRAADLIPHAPLAYRDLLRRQRYLGVLCPLLVLTRPLTPYYVLNITDARIPFTAVVETTNLIDPAHVGGRHLVYLPKYLAPDSDLFKWPDKQVQTVWLEHLRQMFPDFDDSTLEAFIVQRAADVEPLRPINTTHEIPPVESPVRGLYLSNTVMVYPELNNGESVTRQAAKAAGQVMAAAVPAMPAVPV
jgi:protoporphyrinogen oxidase